MADKNIQIKDLQGNSLFPKTKGSLVTNDTGATLGTVEAGAQVNKIEKIKVNGAEVSIVSKEVDIQIPSASEYTIQKQGTADEGYSATYQLYKDSTAVGEKINIPKDMVVQSGTVEEVVEPDQPVSGYQVGDKYIDLVLANATTSHIYILVSDLIDVYTAGTGISISGNQISVNTTALESTFVKAENVYTKTAMDGLLDDKADKSTTLTGYGITDAYTSSQIDTKLNGKANSATSLAGYGIADAYTKTDVDNKLANLLTYEEIV